MAIGWSIIGEAMRAERKRRKLTQTEFAAAIGLSARLVSAIERGERSNYDAGTRSVIEDVLGWEHGSVDHVAGGGAPRSRYDPQWRQLAEIWRTLPQDARDFLLITAEFVGSYSNRSWGDHR